MVTVRFVNEGEVEADKEIAELVEKGLIAPTGRWPGEYEVLKTGAIYWELDRAGGYNIIRAI